MTLHIADPKVVAKIERLAREMGLSEVALVEQAIDKLAVGVDKNEQFRRMKEVLAKFDAIPDRPDAYDPLEWDEFGLPK
jgi:antitoxin VapB